MPLTQEKRDQLNGIIGQMKDRGESEDSIKEMVYQFNGKYDKPEEQSETKLTEVPKAIRENLYAMGRNALALPFLFPQIVKSTYEKYAPSETPRVPGLTEKMADIGQSISYEPQTATGKKAYELMGLPFKALNAVAGGVGGLVKDITGSPEIATAVDVGGQALGPLLANKVVGPVARKSWEKIGAPMIGSRPLTGVETESVLRATKGSKGFRQGMRGRVNQEGVYLEADSALNRMAREGWNQYKQDMAGIRQATNQLDITPVKRVLQDKLNEYGVQTDPQTGKIVRSTLQKKAIKDVEEMVDMIETWGSNPGDLTPMGVDMLKKNLRDFYSPNKNSTSLVSAVADEAKNVITRAIPEYADVMKRSGNTLETINEIRQNLSMKERSAKEAGINKLMSALRDDKTFRRSLIQQLEATGNAPILDQLAGMRMKGIVPAQHGGTQLWAAEVLSAIITGDPKALVMAPLASPRIMGEFLNLMSKATREYSKAMRVGQAAILPFGMVRPERAPTETTMTGKPEKVESRAPGGPVTPVSLSSLPFSMSPDIYNTRGILNKGGEGERVLSKSKRLRKRMVS